MKKILSILMVICLTLSLFACGNKVATATTEGANSSKLIVGTSAGFPPYEYREGNKIVGIDAEIMEAIAADLGYTIEWEDMKFDSLISALASNKVDIVIAGMTVTEDRKKSVDFTETYTAAVQSIIVKKGGSVTNLDEVEGKLIGVQQGTTGDIYASDDYGNDKVQRFNEGADAVQALLNGKIDCVIIDDQVAKNFVDAHKTELELLDTAYTEEEYAMAVKKGNTQLLNQVNKSIRNLKDNGTLYFLFLTSRLEEVMYELKKNNLIVKKMKFVYDINK